MLIKELTQRVQALYSKGVASDDSRLSSRYIYNKMLSVRTLLLSQQIKKKQEVSAWNYQTIPCMEMIEISSIDCAIPFEKPCTVLRSRYRLPKPIMGFTENIIKSIMTIDGGAKIDLVQMNAANYQKGNKYTCNKVNAFIKDGYLFMIKTRKIKYVTFIALFEDPIEAEVFKTYCSEELFKCIDYPNVEFPIDSSMVDILIELTVKEIVGLFTQAQEDLSNNSRDSVKEQSK